MFHFFAYLSRMKLIDRWSLMRCVRRENVQEHSLQVAMLAHALAVIKNRYFNGKVSPEKVALYAIYHDSSEVITGDLPTPIKYHSPNIRKAYEEIESQAVSDLVRLLPEELRGTYHDLLEIPESDKDEKVLVKAADTLSAYIKCLEEKAAGNREFDRAEKGIAAKVNSLRELPEVDYFVKNFLPSFSLTLDEISHT